MKTVVFTGIVAILTWGGVAAADIQVSDSVVIYDGRGKSMFCSQLGRDQRFHVPGVKKVLRVGGGGQIKYELYDGKGFRAVCDHLVTN